MCLNCNAQKRCEWKAEMGSNGLAGFALLVVSPFAVVIAAGLGYAVAGLSGAVIAGVMVAASLGYAIYKFAPATRVYSWYRGS